MSIKLEVNVARSADILRLDVSEFRPTSCLMPSLLRRLPPLWIDQLAVAPALSDPETGNAR